MFILVFVILVFLLLLNSSNSTRSYSSCKISYYGCGKVPNSRMQLPNARWIVWEWVCRLLDLHRLSTKKNSGCLKTASMPNEPQLIRKRWFGQEWTVGSSKKNRLFSFAIQTWLKHKQPENKHTTVSMCIYKLGDLMLANDSKLMASQKIM